MNKVTITVSGPASSGKTTLASAIEDFLARHGFENVEINDINMEMTRTKSLDDRILAAIAPNTKVVINTETSQK